MQPPETFQIEVVADALDRRLLDEFQRGFPLIPRPYAALSERLGVGEAEVLERLRRLRKTGAVSRIGAIITPHRAGWSTLAAMAVPADELGEVAELVSDYPEVNHCYEREHRLNVWFVVTAPDLDRVAGVLAEIEYWTELEVLDLPLEESYRVDLGFPLTC
jgi:DNA-binding Lrp family transcriptional regulator